MLTVAPSKGEEDSDWDYLPAHLLDTVLTQIGLVSDYVRFAVVCKRWRSTAQFHHKKWLKSSQKQLPLLLIHNSSTMKHSLHSVVGKNLVLTKDNLPVPNYSNMRCCGSSHGWLIILQNETLALILINPFTRATIQLPPITKVGSEEQNMTTFPTWWEMFIPTANTMFVLSEDPSLHPDTYQVLAVHSLQWMSLLRSGSETWVPIRQPFSISNVDIVSYVDDAIYYQGKFYIASGNWNRWFLTVEMTESPSPCMIFREFSSGQEQEPYLPRWNTQQKYFVESCKGYLLYIERSYVNGRNEDDELLSDFRVYKVDASGVESPLVPCTQLQSLDGESLFLGFNQSMSVLASEFPDCQPNCIYYAYDYDYHARHFGTRIGVYDLVSQHDKPIHTNICGPSLKNVPPPLWIILSCTFVDED